MAGFIYKTAPENVEEVYDVQTGIRRRGAYVLQKDNLTQGQVIPSFAPFYADLATKKVYPVCNVALYETAASAATTLKIKKESMAYAGMFLSNGTKTVQVVSVDKSNSSYDVLTVKAAAGAELSAGTVLFETTAADATAQKYKANSALYGRLEVADGINVIALLRTAAEIETSKLAIPFSAADKEETKGWFQFND